MEFTKIKMSREDILKDYMNGRSIRDIAETYDTSREAVYQHLRKDPHWRYMKEHVAKMRTLKKIERLNAKCDEIVEGWSLGVSMEDLAKEFGTDRRSISMVLKGALGIKDTTRRVYRNEERDREIRKCYEEGMTQTAIAKKFNLSQPRVFYIINTSDR